ncbi:MAG TPA: tetratricopeptide repeat protein [Chthoniobacterales bacterium]|nr:tetratricopeptide repeat protein [Chthoniobacterales bacterium]
MNPRNFFGELKRRNVYKVAVAYAIVAWLLIQIATQVFPFFEIPNWVIRLVVALLVIGFPVALIFAWAFELTPEGLKRTEDVDVAQSITHGTDRQVERKNDIGAPSVPKKSIAVLPFENLSEDKANVYFADGIQEEILTRLSRIGDLKVISRASTQRYKNTAEPIIDIAKQLRVANILEGGVRKAGDRVRVHVQLIDAQSHAHLWAECYDRQLDDIFAVESEIASRIADSLQAKLTTAERHAITSRPTKNLEAHQLYLKGRHQWKNFFAPGYERVREYFEQAIALDPSYAPAHMGLGGYHAFGAVNGFFSPDEHWPPAEAALRKSLALDDTFPPTYNLLAAVELYYKRNWPAAERAFRRGEELDPNSGEIPHHYAFCLALFGRPEEAIAEFDRAALLDPFFPGLLLHRGRMFHFLRDYDRAIRHYAETLDIYPDYAPAHEYFGDACEKKGMLHEAITQWCAGLRLSGHAEDAAVLEQVFATAGFNDAVRTLAQRRLEQLDHKRGLGEYVPAAEYVFAHVRRGNIDEAFAWFPKMLQEHNWFAFHFSVNPILDPLRSGPRFEEIVASLASKDPAIRACAAGAKARSQPVDTAKH